MRRVLSLLLVVVVALAALAAIAVGIAQRTVWLPPSEVSATASIPSDVPVAITEPGVLETRDGPVTITVTTEAPEAPVVLAVGRETDVLAWVDGAEHASIGGLVAPERLGVRTVPGEQQVPPPADSDLWIADVSGEGGATHVYDPPDGRWLLLVGGSGTDIGAAELTMTWPREVATPWSTPLVVAGTVLLAVAVGLLVLFWRRGDLARARAGTSGRRH